MKKKSASKIVALLALTLGSSALAAPQDNSCVSTLNYQQELTVPSVEHWASDSMFKTGTVERECQMTQKLQNLFLHLQSVVAKAPSSGGKALRGTHSKGTCFKGSYQTALSSDLSDAQKEILNQAGLFKTQQELSATFRFANAASKIDYDWIKDVRALSMSIDLGNKKQDFAFNNVARFQIDSLSNFVLVMEMAKGMNTGEIAKKADGSPTIGGLTSYFSKLYGAHNVPYVLAQLVGIRKGAEKDKTWSKSFVDQHYWSTTSFAITGDGSSKAGAQQVVKFGAMPCSGIQPENFASELQAKNHAEALVRSGEVKRSEDYLSETLASSVRTQPLCFKLFVQFLEEESQFVGLRKTVFKKNYDPTNLQGGLKTFATQIVENPLKTWNAPIHVVGQISINESMDQTSCDDPKNAINVIKHTDGISGIGQINRARAFAEQASQNGR